MSSTTHTSNPDWRTRFDGVVRWLRPRGKAIIATVAVATVAVGASAYGPIFNDPAPVTPPVTPPSTGTATIGGAQAAPCSTPTGTARYVKNGGGGANNGASWTDAWTSPANINWTVVQPGDTIYIDGGSPYVTYTQKWSVDKNGTPGNPIRICPGQDSGHNGIVIFDYSAFSPSADGVAINVGNRSYISISGNYNGERHMEIWDYYHTANNQGGIVIGGQGGTDQHHVSIDYIRFKNNNNPIRINYASQIAVNENRFEGTRGDASVGLPESTGEYNASYVTNNYVESMCQDIGNCNGGPTLQGGPDGVQTGNGVTVTGNTFKATVTSMVTSQQHPDTVQVRGSWIIIANNSFTNVGDSNLDLGGGTSTPHDIRVLNNVFRLMTQMDLYPDFIRLYSDSDKPLTNVYNFLIANNLFIDGSQASSNTPVVNFCWYRCGGTPSGSNNRITNNIWVNTGYGSSPTILNVGTVAPGSWTIDHNVYNRPGGYISWIGTSYTIPNFISSVDTTGSAAAPTFVSYAPFSASNDFRLAAADTAAANTGVSLSSVFAYDHVNLARPQGTAWDRGPYERVGG